MIDYFEKQGVKRALYGGLYEGIKYPHLPHGIGNSLIPICVQAHLQPNTFNR